MNFIVTESKSHKNAFEKSNRHAAAENFDCNVLSLYQHFLRFCVNQDTIFHVYSLELYFELGF